MPGTFGCGTTPRTAALGSHWGVFTHWEVGVPAGFEWVHSLNPWVPNDGDGLGRWQEKLYPSPASACDLLWVICGQYYWSRNGYYGSWRASGCPSLWYSTHPFVHSMSKRYSSAYNWRRERWNRHKRCCDRRPRADLPPPAVVTPPHTSGISTRIAQVDL